MPDKSKDQFRFMRAVEHNPEFAAKVGVPQSVGAKFSAADKAEGVTYRSLPKKKRTVKHLKLHRHPVGGHRI